MRQDTKEDWRDVKLKFSSSEPFLIANIIDWEKYSLLEGEANVFFEDTYIGKTILDVKYASDTLKLSVRLPRNRNLAEE